MADYAERMVDLARLAADISERVNELERERDVLDADVAALGSELTAGMSAGEVDAWWRGFYAVVEQAA